MAGGYAHDIDQVTNHSKVDRTVILVGRTGNGKSATGNSILGKKAFMSKSGFSRVTSTCELQKAVFDDGEILNVIDTPGLLVSSQGEFVAVEIGDSVRLAKDGIHAILLVFSLKCRFTNEEENALLAWRNLFGKETFNYMIIVFTGGDWLEECGLTFEAYLGQECPQVLKDILQLCKNRFVVFDNRTQDEGRKGRQLQQLRALIGEVVALTDGKTYTELVDLKAVAGEEQIRSYYYGQKEKELLEMEEKMERNYGEQQLKRNTDEALFEARMGMNEPLGRMQQQPEQEQAHRRRVESMVACENVYLEEARRELLELRYRQRFSLLCPIL